MLVWGNPDQVAGKLHELKERFSVDEFIVTSHIASHEARLRSYELVAQAFAQD